MLVVGLGGTLHAGSATECALRIAMSAIADAGAVETLVITADDLDLPLYDPSRTERSPQARALVEALRQADGLVLASPSYHGSLSGAVKNALDYVEDTRGDSRVYLDGMPVGCIAVGAGWQGAVSTLHAMRGIAHALRGWPTPYGATVRHSNGMFADGGCSDPRVAEELRLVGGQVRDMLPWTAAGSGIGARFGLHSRAGAGPLLPGPA